MTTATYTLKYEQYARMVYDWSASHIHQLQEDTAVVNKLIAISDRESITHRNALDTLKNINTEILNLNERLANIRKTLANGSTFPVTITESEYFKMLNSIKTES